MRFINKNANSYTLDNLINDFLVICEIIYKILLLKIRF